MNIHCYYIGKTVNSFLIPDYFFYICETSNYKKNNLYDKLIKILHAQQLQND